MIVVYLLTTVIATAWISEMVIQKKFLVRRTLLDIPLLIFLAIQFISFLYSTDQHISWFGYYSRFNGGLASTLCYSLLYWAFVTFMDKKSTEKLINWAIASAVLVAIYGILEHFGIDAKYWVQDVRNRVFSTLGQPNWLAAYLVALIFIPISYLSPFNSPSHFKGEGLGVRYWGNLTLSILLFACLLFTKSRSGILAFGISSAIFWSLLYFKKTLDIKHYLLNISLFALCFLLLGLIVKTPARDILFSKLNLQPTTNNQQPAGPALEVGGTESGLIRQIVWKGALAAWRDGTKNFWIGTGPETFAMAYYAHRPIEHNNTSEWELLYNKAHNEFLNFLTTTGLLGLTSYLILLISMFLIMSSRLKRSGTEGSLDFARDDRVRLALFAGWLSLSVTNFWGFSVVITQILLFLLPAIALTLEVQSDKGPKVQSKLSLFQILGLCTSVTLLLWTLLGIARYWLADLHYAAGQKNLVTFASTQEPQSILDSYNEYSQAYQLNDGEPVIASDFSIAAAYMSILSYQEDSTSSANLAKLAVNVADQAIQKSPTHPNYYKTKARMYLVLAAVDEEFLDAADATLAQAQKISPTDPRIPYNRSLVAKYKEDKEAQIKFLKEAVALRPAYQEALDLLLNAKIQ